MTETETPPSRARRPVQFHPSESLRSAMEARVDRVALATASETVGLGRVAQRDLERYYSLLRDELWRLDLSWREGALLCDLLNGTLHMDTSTPNLALEIQDAFRDVDSHNRPLMAVRWEVDGPRLLGRLMRLGPAAQWAIVEAVERWWAGPYRKEDVEWEESLREVGLIRPRDEMPA